MLDTRKHTSNTRNPDDYVPLLRLVAPLRMQLLNMRCAAVTGAVPLTDREILILWV